jgi:hypothetical protein
MIRVLKRNDWQDDWGLTQFADARFHVAPELVVEHVLSRALPLMNSLMRETPVERLVAPERRSGIRRHEASHDPRDPFAVQHQESLKWQLGIG